MDIVLGKWQPDQGPFNNQGLLVAENALHTPSGWVPFPSPQVFDPTPLPSRGYLLRMEKGSTGAIDVLGYAADEIYSLVPTVVGNPGGWTVRSRASGYTTPADGSWRSTSFGNVCVATNYANEMQRLDIAGGGIFADIPAPAPKARYIATVRSQIMVGDTVDSDDGAVPFRLRWCQWNKPLVWGYDRRYMSDFQDLYDMGNITGLTGGAFVVILLEQGLVRGTFVGPPDIYQFDPVQGQRGCLVPQTVIRSEASTVWWASDGWCSYDGNSVKHIGAGAIDQWFSDQLDKDNTHLMSALADPQNSRLYWLFCGAGNAGFPNRILALSTLTGGWSYGNVEADVLGMFGTPGMSLEDLDVFPTLEDVPGSLDDSAYAGADLRQLAVLSSRGIETLSGLPLVAYFETGELAGGRLWVNEAAFQGVADRSAVGLRIGKRDEPSQAISWSPFYVPQRSGLIKPRREGRNVRFGLQLDEKWLAAQAITINPSIKGSR